MEFAEAEPIAGPENPLRQAGRARIGSPGAVGAPRADGVEVGGQKVGDVGRSRSAIEPPDAVAPLAGPGRLLAGEVVDPDPGMRVDEAERRRLSGRGS